MEENHDMTVEQCISKVINKVLKLLKNAGASATQIEQNESLIVKIEGMNDIYQVLSSMLDDLVSMISEGTRSNQADYLNLEKLVQKHEAEIRNHVRTEQQLRLYIENLENEDFFAKQKLQEIQLELESLKKDREEFEEQNEELKKQLADQKLKKSQQKLIDSKRDLGNKNSLAYSQDSITNQSRFVDTQQSRALQAQKKFHTPAQFEGIDLQQNENDSTEEAFVPMTLRKAKKMLNVGNQKSSAQLTDRKSESSTYSNNIQQMIQSHRKLRDSTGRNSAGLSTSQSNLKKQVSGTQIFESKTSSKGSAVKTNQKGSVKSRPTSNQSKIKDMVQGNILSAQAQVVYESKPKKPSNFNLREMLKESSNKGSAISKMIKGHQKAKSLMQNLQGQKTTKTKEQLKLIFC